MKRHLRSTIARHSQAIILGLAGFVGLAGLLGYRLGSLTHGFSSAEVTTLRHSLSLRDILHDPLTAPLALLQWLSLHVTVHRYFLARFPSVIIAVFALACLGYIIDRWYGKRAAFLGIIFIATSSWFLHVSRSTTPDVLYFAAVPALIVSYLKLRDEPLSVWTRLFWLLTAVSCLFVPGLVWIVLLQAVLLRKELLTLVRHPGRWWQLTVLMLLFLTAGGLLVAALIRQPHLATQWLGLPATWTPWKIHGVRLLQSVSYFVLRGPHTASLWLGRLPILDAVGSLFLVAGVLFYIRHLRAPRTLLLITMFVVSALSFSLNGPVSFSLLVPVIYIIAVGGIAFLLHAWLHVFPRNPLARGVGIGIIAAAVVLSAFYNCRSYFIAWPQNSDTQQVMTLPPPVRTPHQR